MSKAEVLSRHVTPRTGSDKGTTTHYTLSDADEQPREFFRHLCPHYSRGCDLVAPCCKDKAYHCRFCHDEQNDHELDRKLVTRVRCRFCSHEQEVAKECRKCKAKFGAYTCLECRLFDDDIRKEQFHCAKCGICRVGGKENFFHCDTCGYCMNKHLEGSHKCVPNASKSACPVCLEDLHSSRDHIHVSKCGHLIHSKCLQSMAEKGLYRCPQCNMSLGNMERHWSHMDQEVKAWKMPRRYRNYNVKILCNDCHEEALVKFHIIGMKCSSCGSYNTRRTGSEEPPESTDSELSSDSDIDDDNEAGVTPFERHISQLLRSLSARVRALEREGEGGSDFDTDRDSDNDLPELLDDGMIYDDEEEDEEEEEDGIFPPLLADEISGHTYINQIPDTVSGDDHSSAHDSSDCWQTDEEEEFIGVDEDLPLGMGHPIATRVGSVMPISSSTEGLDDSSPDSGFSELHGLEYGSSESGQTCTVM